GDRGRTGAAGSGSAVGVGLPPTARDRAVARARRGPARRGRRGRHQRGVGGARDLAPADVLPAAGRVGGRGVATCRRLVVLRVEGPGTLPRRRRRGRRRGRGSLDLPRAGGAVRRAPRPRRGVPGCDGQLHRGRGPGPAAARWLLRRLGDATRGRSVQGLARNPALV
ncbi:MAG: hypothetical protein AVDCRST_MAG36-1550, partial [uncultured Nocardioidaceae bacterium]